MKKQFPQSKVMAFHFLKLMKMEELTKNTFSLLFEIPKDLTSNYHFQAGQYVTVKFEHFGELVERDFSLTNAPFEEGISLGIKIHSERSAANSLIKNYKLGDVLEISEPKGRFTLVSKPHEFRTIVLFAAGIGITPIFSHIKNLLHHEPRTRIFLFYGNKNPNSVAYKKEIDELVVKNTDRFQVYYFFSQESSLNNFYKGRLDAKKLNLIINQILHLDETDEESTIWDAVDEVLICGKGEMIKTLANACYENGIPKKNIHFELFEAFNDDIYPIEKEFPLLENIEIEFTYNKINHKAVLKDNKTQILQQLLTQNFTLPYSCKSGICGSCECKLEKGRVELLENEYLTPQEENKNHILPCMSFALTKKINLNFDTI